MRSAKRLVEAVAAAKKLQAAQVRNQKKLLRELGVPDLSPEKITERARRRAATTWGHNYDRAERRTLAEGRRGVTS